MISLERSQNPTTIVTLGLRDKLNPYIAELTAMAIALRNVATLPVRSGAITNSLKQPLGLAGS
jgi:hypothetical protein